MLGDVQCVIPTYLPPTYLPTHLLSYLPTYLPGPSDQRQAVSFLAAPRAPTRAQAAPVIMPHAHAHAVCMWCMQCMCGAHAGPMQVHACSSQACNPLRLYVMHMRCACTCGAHAALPIPRVGHAISRQSHLGFERAALRGELQQRPGTACEGHAVERRRLALVREWVSA